MNGVKRDLYITLHGNGTKLDLIVQLHISQLFLGWNEILSMHVLAKKISTVCHLFGVAI